MFWEKENKVSFFKSIRYKLIRGYISAFLISILIILSYFYVQVSSTLHNTVKNYLRSELAVIAQLSQDAGYNQTAFAKFLSKQTFLKQGSYKIRFALFDQQGFLLARSQDFIEQQEAVNLLKESADKIYETIHYNARNKKVIVATQRVPISSEEICYVQFGVESPVNSEVVAILKKTIVLCLPLILLFSVAGGVILTSKLLSPITKLTKAAEKLLRVQSNEKLPVTNTGDELDKLAKTFNAVFDRLYTSYQKTIAFTADASHELRMPITAIKGEAEIVLERERNLAEYQNVLASIIEEMDRLMQMINNLLALTREQSGTEKIGLEKTNLKNLLKELAEFYHAYAETKNIKLLFCSPLQEYILMANPEKLKILFSNLIENAIKYTQEKGKIEIKLSSVVSSYQIQVIDTGKGIDEAEQTKIFERFYRVDKARSRKQGGAGLGLSIAQMIANSHNGRITLKSAPNKGACFTVTLPVCKMIKQ